MQSAPWPNKTSPYRTEQRAALRSVSLWLTWQPGLDLMQRNSTNHQLHPHSSRPPTLPVYLPLCLVDSSAGTWLLGTSIQNNRETLFCHDLMMPCHFPRPCPHPRSLSLCKWIKWSGEAHSWTQVRTSWPTPTISHLRLPRIEKKKKKKKIQSKGWRAPHIGVLYFMGKSIDVSGPSRVWAACAYTFHGQHNDTLWANDEK